MRARMRILVDCKDRYNNLMLTGNDTIVPELCYYISWRGKVIKKAECDRELFEVEFTPSVRLKCALDRIHIMVD
ncbi:MAG: hypothetical protein ACRCX7_12615 [Cetobacterium sp.]|uniref:hypothetical protein n=1 Tax=Cetobacterium sp. TaxID=2071632 RepID=UPI003F36BFCB